MIWVLVGIGAIAGLVLAMFIIGTLLPKGHTLSRTVMFACPAEAVWEAITDYRSHSTWRKELDRVEAMPDEDGEPCWKEVPKSGTPLSLRRVEMDHLRRLVTKINDPKLPFGGTWVFELKPAPDGCQLTITENGEIYNPFFRVMSKFFNLAATMELYLKQLGERVEKRSLPN